MVVERFRDGCRRIVGGRRLSEFVCDWILNSVFLLLIVRERYVERPDS